MKENNIQKLLLLDRSFLDRSMRSPLLFKAIKDFCRANLFINFGHTECLKTDIGFRDIYTYIQHLCVLIYVSV